MRDKFQDRDRLTRDQCKALRLAPGDAVRVMLEKADSLDGILIACPSGPGALWEVVVEGGVIAFNPHASDFQGIARVSLSPESNHDLLAELANAAKVLRSISEEDHLDEWVDLAIAQAVHIETMLSSG